ncbi:MAG: heparinase II/III-family protein, partial [Deltaproteobacteria bacterium]
RGELDPQRLLAEAGGRQPAPREPERHSGLLALRRGETCAVFRAGPHGPDYQLGHAHGDLLSFEVSHGAARIVTDTGTGAYDAGPVRARIRSTRAHNTLAVDEQEQLEAWGSFRVGRRGRARVLRWGSDAHCSWIWAAHDAYRRLPGRPVHHRLLAVADAWVLVLDAVLGAGRHRVASHVHLHPRLPSGTARVVPLGAACGRRAVPLYERFGETQEMAELFVEAGPELPWAGGWLIQLAPAGGEPAVLAFDGRTATARYGSREGPLRARWTPLDPADPCPFELRLCGPVPDSASEARLC